MTPRIPNDVDPIKGEPGLSTWDRVSDLNPGKYVEIDAAGIDPNVIEIHPDPNKAHHYLLRPPEAGPGILDNLINWAQARATGDHPLTEYLLKFVKGRSVK